MYCIINTKAHYYRSYKLFYVTSCDSHVIFIRNQPCNNDKIAKLKSATDLISFNAASEHFSALCNTLAYFRDDVSCGRNNLITFKSNVLGNFGLII